jgi:tRNA threonylcarbamoyl adenosine modification protein YeaZ
MKTILAVDSTSGILSVSLSEGFNILSDIKDDKSMKHMVNIMDDIDHVLRKAGKTIKEIELFAVNLGPGDFTGGRIGISIIKMFSMLSGNPVLGFNSLDVFSVGCMLKNIGVISKSISDFAQFYIMPLMDVKNNEIYCGIYEVNIILNKNTAIFSFDFEDQKYFLNKISGGFLLKSENFNEKISRIINQADLLDKESSLFFDNLSEEDNSTKGLSQIKVQNNGNELKQKKHFFIFTANAIKTYRELFENLKKEISFNYRKSEIIVDEQNTNPSSGYINLLAEYSRFSFLRLLPIAPVYVRDFIAFGKK